MIEQDASCEPLDASTPGYLLFEFWRLDKQDKPDERQLEDVYFLVARGAQPNVTYAGGDVYYLPPRAPRPQSGSNGTLQDGDALSYWRPYHRVVVPRNATSSSAGNGNWYVTVGNMDMELRNAVLRYRIRVTCLPSAVAAPCPTPLYNQSHCSGHGVCSLPPKGLTDAPELNRVCLCDDGWGDYGCQTSAPSLANGSNATAVVPPGQWAFWQLRVPLPEGASMPGNPALLVELNRGGVGGAPGTGLPGSAAGGGDPVLVVMPKPQSGSNRLPWFTDITRYADLRSYFLQQNFHYQLFRDVQLFQASPLSSTGSRYADFYVAVYNNDQRFRDPALLITTANVTVRARWRLPSSMGGAGTSSPLCPGDCFGRGTCYDPWDLGNTGNLPPPLLPVLPNNSGKPADFQCACRGDAGGTMCEGTLRNLSVTTSGDGGRGSLVPGQWYFFVLQIDQRKFDYRANDVAIQWYARDLTGDAPTAYANAFITIDEHAFPREAQLDSDDPFRRGWQIFYNSLAARSNPPQPLQMKGSDLKPGYSYVLGVYNSEYVRQAPYDFSVSVYVPASSRTWLHPYMSVVLGVTASIILCLLMTLCRRLVQRFGWGPFRSRGGPDGLGGPDGPGGPGGRVQVAHMPPRQQGVPGHIIDGFHTYQYTASKAEKEHLARNMREHEQQQFADHQQVQHAAGGGALPPAHAGAVELGVMARGQAVGGAGGGGSDAVAAMAAAAAAAPGGGGAHNANQLVVGFLPPPAFGGAGSSSTPTSSTAAAAAGRAGEEDDEPQCTVCLCEYEEGERITQLPCKHDFHSTCINKWLQTHYTCPICRVSLLPEEELGDQQPAAAGVDGAVVVPIGAGGVVSAADEAAAAGAANGGNNNVAARMVSSRRASHNPAAVAAAPAGARGASAGVRTGSGRRRQAGGVAESVMGTSSSAIAAAPAPAVLVPMSSSNRSVPSAGGATLPSGGLHGTVVAAPAAGAPQLVARGPTATLEGASSSAQGSSAAGSRSPASQARLTAHRLASPRRPGAGAAGGPLPLLDAAEAHAPVAAAAELALGELPGASPSSSGLHRHHH
ncbi:hypothetical protein HYH02_010098 [Chlamydomonas schloesseri]|uniref:RING-type E3 ubiquitin transferase n=1 Tax=Chlamydomonas schloesseri TaxID=2026947 RepID=A0A835TLV8_9CHLO|nr:hypothetical protein HYH02_010098 [Chlamydomonas schloesseri]|eukprot:KAG2441255.1 hypothetical protein HYH02_010098 [Chlamydomonas schloesseri]